jgi:putative acetyltransferase
MKLSTYSPSDIEEIKQLFIKAFSDSEGQSEGLLIGNLVYDLMTNTDDHNLYGFVVTENEKIIGSIFFSKLAFENEVNAFLLSPVAIHTSHQGKGIGQKLINFGLNIIKDNGVELAFTYGDLIFPRNTGHQVKSYKMTHNEVLNEKTTQNIQQGIQTRGCGAGYGAWL